MKKSNKVVLVVDDNEDASTMMCFLIEEMGFVGVAAGTGKVAIERASSLRPFLVLLDVSLPDMSGMDVCRILRTSLDKGAKIVALTGWSITAIRGELEAAGFHDWFVKPIEARTLQNLLAHASEAGEASFVPSSID